MKNKKLLVALTVLAVLAGCAPTRPRTPYVTEYGTFYSPIDAACGYLYQEKTKQSMSNRKWESALTSCRQKATLEDIQRNGRPKGYGTASTGPANSFGNSLAGALVGIAAMQAQQQAQQPVMLMQQPVMRTTNCSFYGNMMRCTEW